MIEYVWMTHTGEEINLTTGSHGVKLKSDGYEEIPRAQKQEHSTAIVGLPGERRTGVTIPKAEGSITVLCRAHGGLSAAQVESRFRAGFSQHEDGQLILIAEDGARQRIECHLITFSAPAQKSDRVAVVPLTVELMADRGLYDQQFSSTGTVVVANPGDAPILPRVRWRQGGELIMPSGAVTTLPTVTGDRTLLLDPSESNVVLDDSGQVDHEVWGSFPVYPEMVPVRQSRTYRVPDGAALMWDVGYLEPWR